VKRFFIIFITIFSLVLIILFKTLIQLGAGSTPLESQKNSNNGTQMITRASAKADMPLMTLAEKSKITLPASVIPSLSFHGFDHSLFLQHNLLAVVQSDAFFAYRNFILVIILLLVCLVLLGIMLWRNNRAKKLTQKSEYRFKTLLENSPSATMIFQSYQLRFANAALETLTEFSREELLKMEIWQLIHPQSLKNLKNDQIHFESDKLNIRTELQIITKTKEIKWIDFSTRSITFDGKPAILASAVDITEKKTYENQVVEAEERYGLIVLATNDGISDLNLNENKLYLSPQWKLMLGFKDHEIENSLEQWNSLLHADDRDRFEYLMEEIRSGRQANTKTEYRIICKDKSFKWVSASFTAVYDKKNDPIRILGTHTDITERKHTEEKLRESEFRYKNFFARNSAVMLILDPETGDIKDANQSALNYYGYSKEKLLMLNMSDINVLDKQTIEEEKEKAIEENRDHNYFRHQLKDGSIRDVAVYSSKINDEKLKLQYAIVFDITERRKAEQELEKAKDFAEEANRVKSFFVSNISHEIRTPLNAIIGLSDLLLEDENLTPEQLENLNSIKYSSDHLLGVINDVLDFSKLEAGKVQLEKTDFDLYKLVKESSKTIEFKTKEKSIGLNVSILPDTPRVLIGDPSRLRQILLNLLSNAVKFTSKGHIDINIRVLKSIEDRVKIRFSVSDTGIGIPEEKQSELFQNFTQANSNTSRKFGGTGLGLSICKKLVELQGGKIGLKSLEGMGSTLWFEMEYQISEKAFIPDAEKLDIRIKNLKGMRILLVEDDKMNQFVMSRLLKKWKSHVDIAENGVEAIEKLEKQKYNVVLMDMHMPQLNGIETTKIIRNQTSDVLDHEVPIIALTADVTSETRELVKEAGMNNFITKPSEQEDMYERIVHTLIHHKTEFFESTDTHADPEKEEKKEQQQNILDDQTKMRIKKALSDIFDDDMDSTLDLIGKFLKDIPRIVVGVLEALYDQDFTTLRQLVHKIKPGYSYMGFTDVSEKIERIKDLSKQKSRINELESLCRELEDDSRDIVRILRDIQREYMKGKSIDAPQH